MCYCDTPEFSRRVKRRARRHYRCGECRKPITPGDLYVYEVQKFDGVMWVSRYCEVCGDWLADISAEVEDPCCDVPSIGGLQEWLAHPDNAPMIAAIEERRRATA